MYDIPDIESEIVSVPGHILAIYGADQDDGGGSSAYLEAGPSCGTSPRGDADIHRNRAYFIGIDSRGREFEIVLAADDHDEHLWHAIHARQTRYRKNW
jgi:hypothetical protein